NYSARSAYLEVLLDGLFRDAIDTELHQGHYEAIGQVYDNFNDPLKKFEDQVESVEKDKTLFAILPYELYGDLLVHWLVTRKNVYNARHIPLDGSMEKIAWAYINSLFDHHFKDTLSEGDFLTVVKGLHYILDEDVQSKYDLTSFGKPFTGEKIVEKVVEKFVYVEKSGKPLTVQEMSKEAKEEPLLLQQRVKNRANSKVKSSSYDKMEVKEILTMALQLSDKLDISITDAFDRAEDILALSQSKMKSMSRSRSRSHSRTRDTYPKNEHGYNIQTHWHQASDPQKITDLAMTIKALLDAKPKAPKKKPQTSKPKSDKLSPIPLPLPTSDYNNMKRGQSKEIGSQQDKV
ncbi:hypothetical protein AX15_007195, partial [Amanita polypyramis BW_CC]